MVGFFAHLIKNQLSEMAGAMNTTQTYDKFYLLQYLYRTFEISFAKTSLLR